jgi:hypothetical protein
MASHYITEASLNALLIGLPQISSAFSLEGPACLQDQAEKKIS